MPRTTTETPTAVDISTEDTPDAAEGKQTFTVERLTREAGAFLGVESHVAVGAFHGVNETDELTVADAKKRVTQWLKAPQETPPTPDVDA